MLEIRKATIDDAKELSKLIYSLEAFSAMQGLSLEGLYDETLVLLKNNQENPNYLIWVATMPKLVGYAVMHIMPNILYSANDAFISELFVSSEARGQQIGSKLLDIAVQAAKERKCFRIQLLNLNDRESYKRRFYKKQSWQERTNAVVFRHELRD